MKNTHQLLMPIVASLIGLAGTTLASDRLSTSYTYAAPSDGKFEDEVAQHEFKIGGSMLALDPAEYTLPLWIGGAYQANVWTFDNDQIDDFDLHKLKVSLATAFQATEEIPVKVKLVPGIHSDMEDIDSDDFRLEGSVVGSYQYSDVVKFVFGAGFGEEFGDPQAFPIGGVKWRATDELQVDLLFPKPRITYAYSDELQFFAAGEPAGGEWNVGEDNRQFDVQQRGYRLGVGAEYQVAEGGWLYAMVGAEGGREISVAVDESEVVDEEDLDDNAFFQIGYRLH